MVYHQSKDVHLVINSQSQEVLATCSLEKVAKYITEAIEYYQKIKPLEEDKIESPKRVQSVETNVSKYTSDNYGTDKKP